MKADVFCMSADDACMNADEVGMNDDVCMSSDLLSHMRNYQKAVRHSRGQFVNIICKRKHMGPA
jgi:hypothetical protein